MNRNLVNIKDFIKSLPYKPGVYIMKDTNNNIIYIGKAKKIKNRVNSYFNNKTNHDFKTKKLVSKIANIDYIITDNELEALILECNLIKKYKPFYNILLKDDKGYKYIKVFNVPYTRFSVVGKKQNDKAIYIGPYMSNFTANKLIESVNRIFKLPTCNRALFTQQTYLRPCLNYYIDLCSGACCKYISIEEYKYCIEQAIKYLKSGMKSVIKELSYKMKQEAFSLNFEEAAKIRDQIKMIKTINSSESVLLVDYKDADVLAAINVENYICVTMLMFRNHKLVDKKQSLLSFDNKLSDVRKFFLLNYYTDNNYKKPQAIYLDDVPLDFELLKVFIFSGMKIIFGNSKHNQAIINLAKNNSQERIFQQLKLRKQNLNNIIQLKQFLKLDMLPKIIEAYDISNFGSQIIVGAMVVFINGKPEKKLYKKFKIKMVDNQNDFRSMEEIIDRRLNHYFLKKDDQKNSFFKLPDIILIDGGYQHISVVNNVIKKYNIEIPIYGMVKNNRHETDYLITIDDKKIDIKSKQAVFLFIKQIQDEIHREAINYSRNLYNKNSLKSMLSEIDGVGIKRQKLILTHFKTIDNLKQANLEDLYQIKGMPKNVAKNIVSYFKNNQDVIN